MTPDQLRNYKVLKEAALPIPSGSEQLLHMTTQQRRSNMALVMSIEKAAVMAVETGSCPMNALEGCVLCLGSLGCQDVQNIVNDSIQNSSVVDKINNLL